MNSTRSRAHGTHRQSIVAGEVPIGRRIPIDAPWQWLEAGWRDVRRVPHISLAYGGFFAVAAALIALGLSRAGALSLMLPLSGGFLLIGPFAATGLYDTSRRLARGETPQLRTALAAPFLAAGQLPFLGVMLLMIFFVWMQLALLLLMLFLGTQTPPMIGDLLQTLLLTSRGLGLLIVGTLIGGALAVVAFSLAAFSAPMLLDRRVDAVSAVRASAVAVLDNPMPMLLWASVILVVTVIGLATLLVGLVLAFPLLAHATWHAYAEVFGPPADTEQD